MTYYGYEKVFRFTFSCGCVRKVGPILEKFAYQYAGLGSRQRCQKHGAPEVDRVVRKRGAPQGEKELGWWKRPNGERIFLTWEPAPQWVRLYDDTEGRYPVQWEKTRLVKIADEETIWRLVGGGHLGGDRPEPADEILSRFRDAASTGGSSEARPGLDEEDAGGRQPG